MAAKKKQPQLPLPSQPNEAEKSAFEAPPASAETSFENAIERLSNIVERLESDGLPLEESLALFEEGVRLARKSQQRLDAAEKRVQELLAFDEEDRPIVEELDSE